MSTFTVNPESTQSNGKAESPKPRRQAKHPEKKPRGSRKSKPTQPAARTNKKAEVIALMKRPKGATLAEITKLTGWQKHTVRGFVSILGSKEGKKITSAKNAAGERSYKISK